MTLPGPFAETVNPDVLVLRSRGLGQFLLVLSVLLAGVVATVIGARGMIVGTAPDVAPAVVFLAFGVLFVAIGGAVTSFRRRTVFDRRARTVAKLSGFVLLAKREEVPFDAFSVIRMHRDACAADESKPLCVNLVPAAGGEPYTIYSGTDRTATDVARVISAHMDLGIENLE